MLELPVAEAPVGLAGGFHWEPVPAVLSIPTLLPRGHCSLLDLS